MPENIKTPVIILVQPQMAENIGMCARAMLNCGLSELRLVAPRDGWPNEAAIATSSGAVAVVEGAKVYPTLAEAVADRKLVLATTARDRGIIKPVLTAEAAAREVILTEDAAIIFGPERAGLTNDDLTHCDAIINIPLNPDYMSLNLAQAVLLVSYEWYKLKNECKKLSENSTVPDDEVATKGEVEALLSHLESGLDEAGFFKTETQKPTMLVNLRNTFQRMRMTSQEVHTFHGMVKALRGGKEWKR